MFFSFFNEGILLKMEFPSGILISDSFGDLITFICIAYIADLFQKTNCGTVLYAWLREENNFYHNGTGMQSIMLTKAFVLKAWDFLFLLF